MLYWFVMGYSENMTYYFIDFWGLLSITLWLKYGRNFVWGVIFQIPNWTLSYKSSYTEVKYKRWRESSHVTWRYFQTCTLTMFNAYTKLTYTNTRIKYDGKFVKKSIKINSADKMNGPSISDGLLEILNIDWVSINFVWFDVTFVQQKNTGKFHLRHIKLNWWKCMISFRYHSPSLLFVY